MRHERMVTIVGTAQSLDSGAATLRLAQVLAAQEKRVLIVDLAQSGQLTRALCKAEPAEREEELTIRSFHAAFRLIHSLRPVTERIAILPATEPATRQIDSRLWDFFQLRAALRHIDGFDFALVVMTDAGQDVHGGHLLGEWSVAATDSPFRETSLLCRRQYDWMVGASDMPIAVIPLPSSKYPASYRKEFEHSDIGWLRCGPLEADDSFASPERLLDQSKVAEDLQGPIGALAALLITVTEPLDLPIPDVTALAGHSGALAGVLTTRVVDGESTDRLRPRFVVDSVADPDLCVPIEDGDHLTVLASDGVPRFVGTIRKVGRYSTWHSLGTPIHDRQVIYGDWYQEGWIGNAWLQLYCHQPPLRAILQKAGSGA